MTDFDALGLSAQLGYSLKDAGFTTPTAIQAGAIPLLLEGRDLLGGSCRAPGVAADPLSCFERGRFG